MELTNMKWILATVILLLVSNISSAQQKPQEQLGKISFLTSCDRKVQPQLQPGGGDAALVLVSAR